MLSRFQKIVLLTFIVLSGSITESVAGGACTDFSINSFNQSWCQTAPYPTSYATVSFGILEDVDDAFRKNEVDKTIIVDLPAGFEFNMASVTATVANSVGGDISACTFVFNSVTQIAVTLTTINSYNNIDSILFDNFEIRAMSPGISGSVLRTGGDFRIDGSVDCPGDGNPKPDQSLGYLFADLPMIYDSSRVSQYTVLPIRKSCGDNSVILEIKVSVTNSCPTPVTEFNFNTTGDVGYSQNPLTNITQANLFYTGNTQGFVPTNLFGSFTSPNGAFTISGSQLLTSSGDHYFYLSYDVPATATIGEGLDARLDSFVFDGTTIANLATPNPTGIRVIIDTICLQPDMPNPSANMQLIPSGSLIIPMDITNQSLIAPFNLNAYGLIHNLLLNDVPVKWAIRSGKARNDTDFTVAAERLYPTPLAPDTISIIASAFIIDSAWVNTPYSQWVQSATQVITNFGNSVAVYKLNEDKTVDVRYELDQRPKIAVFDNGGNQAIHIAILNAAGLTPIDTANPLAGGSYVTVGAGLFTGIDECFTFCSEPHWAGTLADSSITDNIRDFVSRGGNFLAQCRGVDTYENFSKINIVSTNGISIINQTVSHQYSNPDLAFMQFEGDLIENQGGSERNWILQNSSSWRPGFYYAISDANIDTIVASGAHIVSPDSVGGNVFYLGGHDYSPFNTIPTLNAARVYLNASLIPSGRPTLFTLDPGDTLFSCVGYPVQLGGNPTGPNDATYQWSPGTWLDDSTSQNPIATPLDSIEYSVLAYRGGCIVGPFTIQINASPVPIVDAGPDQSVCGGISSINLIGTVAEATGGYWTTTGSGTFGNDSLLITTYSPSSADSAAGTIDIILTAIGGCDSITDTMQVSFTAGPTVEAGPDQTTCDTSGVVLSGIITIATGGTWTTSGTGTFVPSADSLNTTYIPSGLDTTLPFIILTLTTTGTGGCPAISDSLVLSFAAAISANAGPDQTICSVDGQVTLSGTVTVATGGIWSTNTGGTFTPSDTLLNTTYIFSAIDLAAGTVTLGFTTTGAGLCNPVSDSIVITIIPTVNAGADTIVCNNADTIQLNGTVENVLGAQWTTTGTGGFFPNDTTLNAQYNITAADIAAGTIDFILTTIDTGSCPSSSDTMTVTIIPPSTANAGPDQTVCADTAGVALSGSFTNSLGSIWTSSAGGTFIPSPDSLNVIYIPDSAGNDTITLTTTGSCNNASDFLILSVTPAPTVDAGPDTSVCATSPNVPLSGSVTVATGGVWSTTNGTGTFTPSNTNLNPTYNGTAVDTATGTIMIILSTTGNGSCNVHTDTMYITYTPNQISVDAGPDMTACNNTSGIQLAGTIVIALGGTWTSSGSGTFVPDADSLNAIYIPSGADTVLGSVTLTLTTTGNGGCAGLSDSLVVGFLASPTVDAGPDTTVCYTADTIFLVGTITNAGGAVWTSSGSGTFSPDDSIVGAAYVPSAADILNGGVTLTLTTYQSCNNVSDSMTIEIVPTVDAEPDTVVCNDVDTIQLNGVVTGAAGGIWATSGTGTFYPNDTTLNGFYIISTADSAAGGVIITLTSTGNLAGCPPVTDVMTITILPPPVIDAGPDQIICANEDSVFLNGTVTNAGGVWSTNGTGTFYPDSVTINAVYLISDADTAVGLITLTFTTTGSCMLLMDSLQVSITPPPIASFTNTEVCRNSITDFTDQSSGTLVSWDWDFGNGNTSTLQNPQFVFDSSGTNNVTLIVTALNGCTDTLTKPVLVNPAPFADFIADNVCQVDTVYFFDQSTALSPDFIVSYTWDFGDAGSSTLQSPSHLYSTFGSYLVTLIVESSVGCKDTIQKVVTVSPSPVANFSQDYDIVSTEQSVTFTDLSSGSGNIPDTIQLINWDWDFYYESSGIDSSSSLQNPSFLYSDTGQFVIQLVVTNEYNCTDTVYSDIKVHLEPLVPSGFSPDGNFENDILYVLGGPFSKLDFVIYNEWGEIIFVSVRQSDGWDGTRDGIKQPMGVYVYNVHATGIDGKEYHLWGDVTLLR